MTDSTGGYELRHISGGPQLLRISRLGYESRTLRVYLPQDGALQVDVILK